MPLVEIELVSDDDPMPDLAARLADAMGMALGAPDGSTWVRLRTLPRGQYGESGGRLDDEVWPVFVKIILDRRPYDLTVTTRAVVTAVAAAVGRPEGFVHVIYEPDGAGRVAFGGKLIE